MLIPCSYLVHEIVLSQYLIFMFGFANECNWPLVSFPDRRCNHMLVHLLFVLVSKSLTYERSLLLSKLIFNIVTSCCNYHSFKVLGIFSALLHNIFGLRETSASALGQVRLGRGAEGRHGFDSSD
jgi:hypothetical protein